MSLTVPALQLALNSSEKSILAIGLRTFCSQVLTQTGSLNNFGFFGLPRPNLVKAAAKKLVFNQESWEESKNNEEENDVTEEESDPESEASSNDHTYLEPFSPYRNFSSFESDLYLFPSKNTSSQGLLENYLTASPQLEEFFVLFNLSEEEKNLEIEFYHLKSLCIILHCTLNSHPQTASYISSRILNNFMPHIQKHLEGKTRPLIAASVGLINYMSRVLQGVPDIAFNHIITTGIVGRTLMHFRKVKKTIENTSEDTEENQEAGQKRKKSTNDESDNEDEKELKINNKEEPEIELDEDDDWEVRSLVTLFVFIAMDINYIITTPGSNNTTPNISPIQRISQDDKVFRHLSKDLNLSKSSTVHLFFTLLLRLLKPFSLINHSIETNFSQSNLHALREGLPKILNQSLLNQISELSQLIPINFNDVFPSLDPLTHSHSHTTSTLPSIFSFIFKNESKISTLEETMEKFEKYLKAQIVYDVEQIKVLDSNYFLISLSFILSSILSPLMITEYLRKYSSDLILNSTQVYNLPKRIVVNISHSLFDSLKCSSSEIHRSIQLFVLKSHPLSLRKAIVLVKAGSAGSELKDELYNCINHLSNIISYIEVDSNVTSKLHSLIEAQQSSISLSSFRSLVMSTISIWFPAYVSKKDIQKLLTDGTDYEKNIAIKWICAVISRIYQQFFVIFSELNVSSTHKGILEQVLTECLSEFLPDFSSLFLLRQKLFEKILLLKKTEVIEEKVEVINDMDLELNWGDDEIKPPTLTVSELVPSSTLSNVFDSTKISLMLRSYFCSLTLYSLVFPSSILRMKIDTLKILDDFLSYFNINNSTPNKLDLQYLPSELLFSLLNLMLTLTRSNLCPWFSRNQILINQNNDEFSKPLSLVLVRSDWEIGLQSAASSSSSLVILLSLALNPSFLNNSTLKIDEEILSFTFEVLLSSGLFNPHCNSYTYELETEAYQWAKIACESATHALTIFTLVRFAINCPRLIINETSRILKDFDNLSHLPFSPLIILSIILSKGHLQLFKYALPGFIQAYIDALYNDKKVAIESTEGKKEKTKEDALTFFSKFKLGFRQSVSNSFSLLISRIIPTIRNVNFYLKNLSNIVENIPSPLGIDDNIEFAFSHWEYLFSNNKFNSVTVEESFQSDSLNSKINFCVKNLNSLISSTDKKISSFLDHHWPVISILWCNSVIEISTSYDKIFEWILIKWKSMFTFNDNVKCLSDILLNFSNPFDICSILFLTLYHLSQLDRIILSSFNNKVESKSNKKISKTINSLIKFSKNECVSCYALSDFLCNISLSLTSSIIKFGNQFIIKNILDFLLDCDYIQENLLHQDAFGMMLRQIISYLLDANISKIAEKPISFGNVKSNLPGFLWPKLFRENKQNTSRICSLKYDLKVYEKIQVLSSLFSSKVSISVSSSDPTYCLLLSSLVEVFKKQSDSTLAKDLKSQLCSIRLSGVEAKLAEFTEFIKSTNPSSITSSTIISQINDSSLQMLKYSSFSTLYKIISVFYNDSNELIYNKLVSIRNLLQNDNINEDESFSEWLNLTINSMMPQIDINASNNISFFEPCIIHKNYYNSFTNQINSFISSLKNHDLKHSQIYEILSEAWSIPIQYCFPQLVVIQQKLKFNEKTEWNLAIIEIVSECIKELYKGKENELIVNGITNLVLEVLQILNTSVSTGKRNGVSLSKKEIKNFKEYNKFLSNYSLNLFTLLFNVNFKEFSSEIILVNKWISSIFIVLNSDTFFSVNSSTKTTHPYVFIPYSENKVSLFTLSPHSTISLFIKTCNYYFESSSSIFSSLNKCRQSEEKLNLNQIENQVEKYFESIAYLLSVSNFLKIDKIVTSTKINEENDSMEFDLNVEPEEKDLLKDSNRIDIEEIGFEIVFPSLVFDISNIKKSLLKLIRITLKFGYGEKNVSLLLENILISLYSHDNSFFKLILNPTTNDFFHPFMLLKMIQTHSQFNSLHQSCLLSFKNTSNKVAFSTVSQHSNFENIIDTNLVKENDDLEMNKNQKSLFNNLLRLILIILSLSLQSYSKSTLPDHYIEFYNLIKSLYQGSISLKDRIIFRIIYLFNYYSLGEPIFTGIPNLDSGNSFGPLTYNNLCEFLKVGKVNQTISNYPIWRSSNQPFSWEVIKDENYPGSEYQLSQVKNNLEKWQVENISLALINNNVDQDNFDDSNEFIYDPSYILPLIYIVICRPLKSKPKSEVETPYYIRQFILNGGLSLLLSSLSLNCPLLRSLVLSSLNHINIVVEKQGVEVDSSFRERAEVARILQYVHDAITPNNNGPFKNPPHISIFLGKALQTVLQPRHELFRITNYYLNLRPFMDINDVPLFDQVVMDLGAFASSNTLTNSNSFPSVLLTVLRQLSHSLLSPQDHQNYSRKNVYSRISSLLSLVQNDIRVVNYILDFFDSSLSLKKSVIYFIERLNATELFFVNIAQLLKTSADTSILVLDKQSLINQQSIHLQNSQSNQQQIHHQLLVQLSSNFSLSTRYINLLRKLWSGVQVLFIELQQVSNDLEFDMEEKKSLSRIISVGIVNCGSSITNILNIFVESPQLLKIMFTQGLFQSLDNPLLEILHVLILFIWEYFSSYNLMFQASLNSEYLSPIINNTNSIDTQVLQSFISLFHSLYNTTSNSDSNIKHLYFSSLLLLNFIPKSQINFSDELLNVLLRISLSHISSFDVKIGKSYIINPIANKSTEENQIVNLFSPILFRSLYNMIQFEDSISSQLLWESTSKLKFNSSTLLPSTTFSNFNIVQIIINILSNHSSKSIDSLETSLSWLLTVSKLDFRYLFNPKFIKFINNESRIKLLINDPPKSLVNYIFSNIFSTLDSGLYIVKGNSHAYNDYLTNYISYPLICNLILQKTLKFIELVNIKGSKLTKNITKIVEALCFYSNNIVDGKLNFEELKFKSWVEAIASFSITLLTSELKSTISESSYLKEHEEVISKFNVYIDYLESLYGPVTTTETSNTNSSLFPHLLQIITEGNDSKFNSESFNVWKRNVLPNLDILTKFKDDSDNENEKDEDEGEDINEETKLEDDEEPDMEEDDEEGNISDASDSMELEQ